MAATHIHPLKALCVSTYQIPAHGRIPNTSIQHYPLLIYHSAFPSTITASKIENHLKFVGVVEPQWRFAMYDFTHFHSTTHEVLCISNGRAKLCFGGEENKGKVEITVHQGDVVVVPAGVGHRMVKDTSSFGTFEMVGAYPKGCDQWDTCKGEDGEEDKLGGIESLDWFEQDPVYGEDGPVLKVSNRN
jgi:uncharacterized protein YjlB